MPALAPLLLKARDTITLAVLNAVGILIIAVLQNAGALPDSTVTGLSAFVSTIFVLVIGSFVAAGLAFITIRDHERTGEHLRFLLLRGEQLTRNLKHERTRFEDFSDVASDWLFEFDVRGICTYSAGRYMLSLSTGSERVLGLHYEDIIDIADENADTINDGLKRLRPFEVDHATSCLEGEVKSHFRLSVKPFFDDAGALQGLRGVAEDITHKVELDAQIKHMARHDELTGLVNRNVVRTKLDELDPAHDVISATLIDLDGFKEINDTYGHGVGDLLLKQVAKRLNACVGSADIVARLGGDEFLILSAPSTDDAELGNKVLKALVEPLKLGEFELSISGSVGQSHFPGHTDRGDQLLVKADLALYAAKNAGRNAYRVFQPAMEQKLQYRLQIVKRLRKAIQDCGLSIKYQPQYCLQEGRLLGFEALARWEDEELGCIGPDVFVPIAEECGLISSLGEFILRTACDDAMAWPQPENSSLTLSINISPEQFSRGDLVADVKAVLKDTGFPPSRLELEITEGVLIADTDKASSILRSLSSLGVSIAIDDFGTGYSSLSYLRSLPINRLKIDRSFTNSLHESSVENITKTIVQMGHTLGLHVMAEGVETAEQQACLMEMNCLEVQGYLYAKPLPVSKVAPLIITDHTRSGHMVPEPQPEQTIHVQTKAS